jgi:uncharacterized membrane protein YsdA (DUF1294 family)
MQNSVLDRKRRASVWTNSLSALLVLAIPICLCYAFGKPPSYTLWTYLLVSLATFAVYAWDKAAAQRGEWRVAEVKLHILSLLGGWPGAIIGQQILRHKSNKPQFRAVFWITVILNIALLLFLSFFFKL